MEQKLYLPVLKRMTLENFSLYESEKNLITIDFDKPVTCIIGANGLGKSTLLNCLNYGLTGIVNDPKKKFRSVGEFPKISARYASEYFDGRISELDRDFASVTVEMIIAGHELSVSRSFFPDNSVVRFSCDSDECGDYEDTVVALTGLRSFEQFVFLQMKVLTFDEERGCLFWEPSLLTPALFLTMGLGPDIAEAADLKSREIQKSNSRIRNLQFEINKHYKRIEILREEASASVSVSENQIDVTEVELREAHNALLLGIEEAKNEYEKLRVEQGFLNAKIAELSAKQHQIKNDYDELYKMLFATSPHNHITSSPIMIELHSGRCSLCNGEGHNLAVVAEALLNENKCPLCQEVLDKKSEIDEEQILAQLKVLDDEMHSIGNALNNALLKANRTENEMQRLAFYIEDSKRTVMQYEHNVLLLSHSTSGISAELRNRIQTLEDAILQIEVEKDKEVQRRDDINKELTTLHNLLNERYAAAQVNFLPKFRTLAKLFTGLDVDIRFTQQVDDARLFLAFSLVLNDSGRKYDHQLSESQRFFLDIALRMAIVDYISDGSKQGFMLIDTPEGSLDIAYEVNAGEMFSEFVRRGHQLISTANLNSSGLVRTLAKEMGLELFNLVNIIKWANLSSIQIERHDLFDSALIAIQEALGSGQS